MSERHSAAAAKAKAPPQVRLLESQQQTGRREAIRALNDFIFDVELNPGFPSSASEELHVALDRQT